MTITESRPKVDWDKQRRKKRRRRLDTVDAGLVLVAAVLLGVGSHLFTNSLFRSHTETLTAVVPETLPSTTLPASSTPGDLALNAGFDGVVTDRRTLTVTGTATPGADVRIGGLRSTSRSDGSWAIAVLLQPGVNELTVESRVNNERPIALTFSVTYEPSTTTSAPVAPTVGTTATIPPATTTATTASTTTPTTVASPSTTRAKPPTTTATTTATTMPTTASTPPVDTDPPPPTP